MWFKEKPKEVEARLFDGDTASLMDVVEWIKAQGYAWSDPFTPLSTRGITMDPGTGFLGINTDGETTYVERGDWVYLDVDGKIKKAKGSEFAATYEPIEAPVDPTPAEPAPGPPTQTEAPVEAP